MGKHKMTIAAIVGCIAILAGVIHFSLQKNSEESPTDNNDVSINQEDLIQITTISKQDEYNQLVRKDIFNGNVQRVDSNGIRNRMPSASDYNDSTPLIEMRFYERDFNNIIKPLYLERLSIESQADKGELISGGGYLAGGYGLRLGLAKIGDGLSSLLWDREYSTFGTYYLGDPNDRYAKRTSEVKFRTPKSLGPGEIYRVDLILIDRIKEKE